MDAEIWILAPVCGLRPVVALRLATENVPNPTRRTSWPFFNVVVMLSNTLSTALTASAFVRPEDVATAATRSFLFTVWPSLGLFRQCLEREARIQTRRSLEGRFSGRQSKRPGNPRILAISANESGDDSDRSEEHTSDLQSLMSI